MSCETKRHFSFSSIHVFMDGSLSRWRSWLRGAPQVSTPVLQDGWMLGCTYSPLHSPAASSAWLGHCGGAVGRREGALCGFSNRLLRCYMLGRSPQTWVLVPGRSHTELRSPETGKGKQLLSPWQRATKSVSGQVSPPHIQASQGSGRLGRQTRLAWGQQDRPNLRG